MKLPTFWIIHESMCVYVCIPMLLIDQLMKAYIYSESLNLFILGLFMYDMCLRSVSVLLDWIT